MREERSEVRWGGTRIAYGIERSGRRRTVAVRVAPPGEVVLVAPEGTPVERLDEVVRGKASWIAERLKRVRPEEPRRGEREWVSGEACLYLGRQYRLEVRGGEEEVKLEGGRLRVRLEEEEEEERARRVREAVEGWYRERARERLRERVERWAERVEVEVPRVVVREQEKRWGSCGRGVVRLNWRIIQGPMKLVDYVVAHEVVHLVHDDHGRGFWAALGRVMPDYEERKERLKAEGPRWVW